MNFVGHFRLLLWQLLSFVSVLFSSPVSTQCIYLEL